MSGMMDARCRCGKRFGWRGKVTDRPPCPSCGHALPLADLEREQAKIERILSACGRKLPCGHTEADLCGGPFEPKWCGPCRAEANARKKAGETPLKPYEPPAGPEPHGARRSP